MAGRYTLLLIVTAFVLNCSSANGQNTLRNYGNLKVFEEGNLGLQTHLINDGSFDENFGRVGFYGENTLSISGIFSPDFYDFELFLEPQLTLNIPIRISNSAFFFSGDITTDMSGDQIYTHFTNNAVHQGVNDGSKVDGYVLIDGQPEFEFPIGDTYHLRPLYIYFQDSPQQAKCAYFAEDPNQPIDLNGSYDTRRLDIPLQAVSNNEFWILKTKGRVRIKLPWNEESLLPSILTMVDRITIAGWNTTTGQWEDLGNSASSGNLGQGSISSRVFDATNYELVTFASLFSLPDIEQVNYLVTANGDGFNDRLVLPELQRYSNNQLTIYNRNGVKVFQKSNYTDEFDGFSNTENAVINRSTGLPNDVYYYFAKMYDADLETHGYLYLTDH